MKFTHTLLGARGDAPSAKFRGRLGSLGPFSRRNGRMLDVCGSLDEAMLLNVCASLALAKLAADCASVDPPLPARALLTRCALGVLVLLSTTSLRGPLTPALERTDGTLGAMPLLYLLIVGVWAGVRIDRGHEPPLDLARASLAALVCFALGAWPPVLIDATTTRRLWLLFGAHLCACALDCRAHAPSRALSPPLFVRALSRAIAYVAPAAPFIWVCASAALFGGTSLLTAFGLPPERLRWLVAWGAFHSPAWFVHLATRRACATALGAGQQLPAPSAARSRPPGRGEASLAADGLRKAVRHAWTARCRDGDGGTCALPRATAS